jgi:flagellar hook-associated protein 3 FlgL
MRITQNMMSNTMMLNINRNMKKLNDLYTQMSTLKKIQRPSDDPIIAGRALKYRTRVAETSQYKENIDEAVNWMDVTESSIDNIQSVLDSMREKCNQAANDTNNIKNQKTIADQLEELKKQLMHEGNTSYDGGRYLFSGFRTDTKLIFDKENTEHYKITEKFTSDDIQTAERVTYDGGTPSKANGLADVTRIRLAYDNVEGSLQFSDLTTDPKTDITASLTVNTVSSSKDLDAYKPAAGEINYIEDTGELILGQGVTLPDKFDITYEKQDFKEGDVDPRNYFDCEDLDSGEKYTLSEDKIQYEVGINNKMGVNTLGKDVVTKDLLRDIDELIKVVNYAHDIDKQVEKIEQDETLTEDEKKEQINKLQMNVPNISEQFSDMLGKIDKHAEQISNERADLGNRMKRLELTQDRLAADEVNFKELMTNNESIDLEEVFTEFSMQQSVYNSSLMAASKIIQQTLVDFVR